VNAAAATLGLLMVAIVLAFIATLYSALQMRFRFPGFARRLSSLFGLLLVVQSSLIGIQLVGQRTFGGGYELVVLTAWGLLAGALLIPPGFITDAFGLLLLIPPVRSGIRAFTRRRLGRRTIRRVEIHRYDG